MPPDEDWEWTFSHVHRIAAEDLLTIVELLKIASSKQWPYLRQCAMDSVEDYSVRQMIFHHDYPWRFRLEQFCNAYFSRTT